MLITGREEETTTKEKRSNREKQILSHMSPLVPRMVVESHKEKVKRNNSTETKSTRE